MEMHVRSLTRDSRRWITYRLHHLPGEQESGGWIVLHEYQHEGVWATVCDNLYENMCRTVINAHLTGIAHLPEQENQIQLLWPLLFLKILNTQQLRKPMLAWLEKRR